MVRARYAVAMTAAAFLAAQPCAAAAEPRSTSETRVSTFAGINIRMPLGKAERTRPSARLQLTTSYSVRDVRTGAIRTIRPHGLEIGAAGNGAPAFYLNDQNRVEMQERLRLSGSTPDVVWIVLGVGLVAVVVLLAASGPILPRSPLPE